MKLNELKQERNEKIGALEKMVSENKERSFTAEQDAEYQKIEQEIESLDRNIERLEKLESRNKSIVMEVKEPETRGFSIHKFFSEAMNGKLTGVELEGHNRTKELFSRNGESLKGFGIPMEYIFSRGNVTTSTETNLLKTGQLNELSIIKTPAEELLSKLGVRIFSNLNGKFDIPYSAQLTASFLDEGATGATASFAPGKETLSPRTISITIPFTREYLAQISPEINSAIKVDMKDGIFRGVIKDLFTQVTGNTSVDGDLSGYTWENVTGVQGKLELASLNNPSYVTTLANMSSLKATPKTGTTYPMYLVENGKIDGFNLVGTSLSVADKLIFGDFNYSVVGLWGGIDVLIDPYSHKPYIDVEISALCDTGIINPYAFAFINKA